MAEMRNLDISNTRVEMTVDLSEVFSERINWVVGNENEKKTATKKTCLFVWLWSVKPKYVLVCRNSKDNCSDCFF